MFPSRVKLTLFLAEELLSASVAENRPDFQVLPLHVKIQGVMAFTTIIT